MGYYIFMLVSVLVIPLLMLLLGIFLYKRPPKEINDLLGYRTARSKKNPDTWAFANRYCGKLWTILGAVCLVLTAAVMLPLMHAGEKTVTTAVMILFGVHLVVILGSIIPVERALKRTFDENGSRR